MPFRFADKETKIQISVNAEILDKKNPEVLFSIQEFCSEENFCTDIFRRKSIFFKDLGGFLNHI
jgi:hypothetical protein